MKLWKVELRGCGKLRKCYAVAEDPTTAYKIVRAFLDEKDLGFKIDRELDNITLLAEDIYYSECETMLYIQDDCPPSCLGKTRD